MTIVTSKIGTGCERQLHPRPYGNSTFEHDVGKSLLKDLVIVYAGKSRYVPYIREFLKATKREKNMYKQTTIEGLKRVWESPGGYSTYFLRGAFGWRTKMMKGISEVFWLFCWHKIRCGFVCFSKGRGS